MYTEKSAKIARLHVRHVRGVRCGARLVKAPGRVHPHERPPGWRGTRRGRGRGAEARGARRRYGANTYQIREMVSNRLEKSFRIAGFILSDALPLHLL